MESRRSVWFELFYDLIVVAALVNGCHLIEHSPTISLGAWLGTTLAVMLVLWALTALHANLYQSDTWTTRILILIQMFSMAIAILAIGRIDESLPDGIGFVALAGAFLSIALLYALADRSRHPDVAHLVIWTTGVAGAVLLAGAPFVASATADDHLGGSPLVEQVVFALAALIGCVPVFWTLLGRLVRSGVVNVGRFSERLNELLLIVMGESVVEVVIRLDGLTHIPNLPVLAAAFLVPFAIWSVYFTLIEPRGLPAGAGPMRLWFLAYYLLIFGLMAISTRLGVLVELPWQETFSLPVFWTVLPLVYVAVALVALWRITRPTVVG